MTNCNFIRINQQGLTLEGKGTKGRPFRLYLEPSDTPYFILISDEEGNEVLNYQDCRTGSMLYYRLKDYYNLTVSNLGTGRVKLL